MAVPPNRAFLDPAVEAKLHELETTMQRAHGFAGFASNYGHVSQVLACSRGHGVPATLVVLERARSFATSRGFKPERGNPDSFFGWMLSFARGAAPSTPLPVPAAPLVAPAVPAEPLDFGVLEALGALNRLRGRGIALEEHRSACSLLRELPLNLRLTAVELLAARGAATCPLCGVALPDEPQQLVAHLWAHETGLWEEEGRDHVAFARMGKPFSVSGSMLGNYFDLHGCNRWLHRRAQRTEQGRREQDIESLVDPFRAAHAARGNDFEVDLCASLERDGLPIEWGAGLEAADGRRVRFVSEAAYDALPDRRGFGKLVDLKLRAMERCGCPACRGGAADEACNLLDVYRRVSQEALQREGGVPTVLYQLMVNPPTVVSPDVALSYGYLDYVLLVPTDGAVHCTVVDAKATNRVKLGAKVQVTYYSIVLGDIASSRLVQYEREARGVPPLRMSKVGGVWLYGRDAPVPFALAELERMVRDFVLHQLPRVLSAQAYADGSAAQAWELRPSCLGCSYLKDCKRDAQRQRHVGAIPGLTRRRQLELERAVPQMRAPDPLGRLTDAAAQAQPDEHVRRLLSRHLLVRYDASHVPIKVHGFVSPRLAALCGGAPCLNGQPSLTLPASEEAAIHVVLLEDPVVRRLYAWALRVRGAEHCGCIDAEAVGGAHYDAQEVEFVLRLDEVLTRVGGASRAVYLAERHEHATLMRTLMAGAMRLGQDAAGAVAAHPQRCLRCLLTLIALPDLVRLSQQPDLAGTQGGVVPSACVVLAEEVRHIVSLPGPGPWRFDDECAGLVAGWSEDPAPPTTELAYAAWRHRRTMGADAVRPLLLRRLDTGVRILGALRRLCASHPRGSIALLPNAASRASGPPAGLAMEPEMSKLCFIALLEAHTQHRSIVALRAAPLEQRLAHRRGKTFLLRLDDVAGEPDGGGPVDVHLTAVAELLGEVPVGVGGNEWLLCPHSDAGLVDVMRWDDLRVRDRPPQGQNRLLQEELPPSHVLLAEVRALRPADRGVTLRVQCSATRPEGAVPVTRVALTPGAEYVLQPRFIDFTTAKVVGRLREDSRLVAQYRDPLSARLLRYTRRVGKMAPTPPAPAVSDDVLAALPMTASQQAVYDHVCGSVLTLTWGPPGSGKTHFLAAAIGRLLVASARTGRPMRVLVTAFTHDALNHLLGKLARMLTASALLDGDLPVFKLGHSSGPIEVDGRVRTKRGRGHAGEVLRVLALEVDGVRVRTEDGSELTLPVSALVRVNDYGDLSPGSALGQLAWPQVVLGATVFQMGRIHEKLLAKGLLADADAGYFDVLVVDEASQMQLPHVLPPLHLLRARPLAGAAHGGGRLVVVGDTRQMGPILQNEYPADAQLCEGSPPPHWSLLRWLWARTLADAEDLHSMLQENHRMTPHLGWFTEHVLGYDGYRACGECGCRCHRAFPDCAVPLLQLSRSRRSAPSLVAEALRPAHTFVLVELDPQPDPAAAVEDEAALVAELVASYLEWRGDGDDDSVFVVTPHHVQRIAVLRRLEQRGVRSGQVCVDTVEKMQGQERDLAVVCYGGLVDLDEPGELDFTYSRERLNTAVTRAKKKCVLICTLDVLQPSVAACETAERQAGFELLRRISAHCPVVAEHGCVRLQHSAVIPLATRADSQETVLSGASQDRARPSQLSSVLASQPDDDDADDDDDGAELLPPRPVRGPVASRAGAPRAVADDDDETCMGSQETRMDSPVPSAVTGEAIHADAVGAQAGGRKAPRLANPIHPPSCSHQDRPRRDVDPLASSAQPCTAAASSAGSSLAPQKVRTLPSSFTRPGKRPALDPTGSAKEPRQHKEHTCRTCGKPMKGHPKRCPDK